MFYNVGLSLASRLAIFDRAFPVSPSCSRQKGLPSERGEAGRTSNLRFETGHFPPPLSRRRRIPPRARVSLGGREGSTLSEARKPRPFLLNPPLVFGGASRAELAAEPRARAGIAFSSGCARAGRGGGRALPDASFLLDEGDASRKPLGRCSPLLTGCSEGDGKPRLGSRCFRALLSPMEGEVQAAAAAFSEGSGCR